MKNYKRKLQFNVQPKSRKCVDSLCVWRRRLKGWYKVLAGHGGLTIEAEAKSGYSKP